MTRAELEAELGWNPDALLGDADVPGLLTQGRFGDLSPDDQQMAAARLAVLWIDHPARGSVAADTLLTQLIRPNLSGGPRDYWENGARPDSETQAELACAAAEVWEAHPDVSPVLAQIRFRSWAQQNKNMMPNELWAKGSRLLNLPRRSRALVATSLARLHLKDPQMRLEGMGWF